ncbi:MAG: hypothetical protein R3182_03715, partial [Draconibacterium sp.]|nr:hypothetical protein [Draconibacterium sp.]
AYLLRGLYYRENSRFDIALNDIHKSIELNPNYWKAYDALSQIYTWDAPDMVKALEYGHKAVNLHMGKDLIRLYRTLGFIYSCIYLFEEAKEYFNYSYELTGYNDSAIYFLQLGTLEQYQGNYKKADEYLQKALKTNTSNPVLFRRLGGNYNLMEDYEKSLYYYKMFFKSKETEDIFDLGETHRLAQAYYETGNIQKAEEYFNKQINDCKNSIKKNRGFAQSNRALYDLAVVYAFKGMKEEAYKNLDEFIKMDFIPLWWVNLAKDDPLMKSLREEQKFQDIIIEMESKFQKEQDRVKLWLESNNP